MAQESDWTAIALGRGSRQPDRPHGRSKGGFKGHGDGKRIHGRKRVRRLSRTDGVRRLTLTDTDGRLLAVEVHAADVQESDSAKGVLNRFRRGFPFVERVYADGGYAGRIVAWAQTNAHVALEIVRRPRDATGFIVIRRRWVVEQTFAWIMKCRRLVRDDEQLTRVAEALIIIAAIATLVRRR